MLIVWHVSAVFLAPLSIPPSSPLVVDIAQGSFMQWYLDALYLNHGYHFFAPEPSNGHLIRYQVIDDRGGIIAQGEFPNKKDNWPRLLYHRYFMLADQCEVAAATDAEANQWQQHVSQSVRPTAAARAQRRRGPRPARVHYPLRLPRRTAQRQAARLSGDLSHGNCEVVQRTGRTRRATAESTLPNQSGMYNSNWRQDVASGWQGGVAMSVLGGIRSYIADVWEAWNEFWFTPTNPSTLSAIRVFAGAMLFYTHLVWSFDLSGFFGQNGWLPAAADARRAPIHRTAAPMVAGPR